jgi:serine/threonine-protein kinase
LQEILYRALERDPRHRYATASEMAWELTHQDQVGVEDGNRRPALRGRLFLNGRKLLLYAALLFVPLALFALMLLLARR